MSKARRLIFCVIMITHVVNSLCFAGVFVVQYARMTGHFEFLRDSALKIIRCLYLEEYSMTFWLIAAVFFAVATALIFFLYRKDLPKINMILFLIASVIALAVFATGVFVMGALSASLYKIDIVCTWAILLCTVFAEVNALVGLLKAKS